MHIFCVKHNAWKVDIKGKKLHSCKDDALFNLDTVKTLKILKCFFVIHLCYSFVAEILLYINKNRVFENCIVVFSEMFNKQSIKSQNIKSFVSNNDPLFIQK